MLHRLFMFMQHPVRHRTVGDNIDRTIIDLQLLVADLVGPVVMKVPVNTGNGFDIAGNHPQVVRNKQDGDRFV
jgi:hypothetical protein